MALGATPIVAICIDRLTGAGMAWVLFEVFLAFGLAVFIVWWTFPRRRKPQQTDETVSSMKDARDR